MHEAPIHSLVEESTGQQDHDFIVRLLDGTTDMQTAQALQHINVRPMCSCLQEHLDQLNAMNACDPDGKLLETVDVWLPWCRLLDECETVGQQLLSTAYVCKLEGMNEYEAEPTKNTMSVLCKNKGNNSCAMSMEALFVRTHANFSQLVERDEQIGAALGENYSDYLMGVIDDIETQMGEGKGGGQADGHQDGWERVYLAPPPKPPPPPPPPFPPGVHADSRDDFKRLSQCFHRAGVNHASLDLPLGLRQISGNGTYTSYADLFYDRCGVEYDGALRWDLIYEYGGYNWILNKWENGGTSGKAVAIAILVLDVVIFLFLCFWLFRCVQKGGCFWICVKASEGETEGLTGNSRQASDDQRANEATSIDDEAVELGEMPQVQPKEQPGEDKGEKDMSV